MEVKEESMYGGMDDMMCGMMEGHTPQTLLAKIAEGEKMEAALYAQIAQMVPSEELRCIIMCKARHERHMGEMMTMVSQSFGAAPACASPLIPLSKEEKE